MINKININSILSLKNIKSVEVRKTRDKCLNKIEISLIFDNSCFYHRTNFHETVNKFF